MEARRFMNRPIRGPSFLELDEDTGLLRPSSLAKLLHPDPVPHHDDGEEERGGRLKLLKFEEGQSSGGDATEWIPPGGSDEQAMCDAQEDNSMQDDEMLYVDMSETPTTFDDGGIYMMRDGGGSTLSGVAEASFTSEGGSSSRPQTAPLKRPVRSSGSRPMTAGSRRQNSTAADRNPQFVTRSSVAF